jgi:hypothetical protein
MIVLVDLGRSIHLELPEFPLTLNLCKHLVKFVLSFCSCIGINYSSIVSLDFKALATVLALWLLK